MTDNTGTQALWPQMIAALAAIDRQLGLDADGCNSTGQTLAAIKDLQAAVQDLTHQVICCGVAASHPDPMLTTRGAYAGKWNSAQAEKVRKLRLDRDRLRAALADVVDTDWAFLGTDADTGNPSSLYSRVLRGRQALKA